jgi:hypothetical protein
VHPPKATASVKQIDLASRTLVILAENGLESIVVIGPQVRNLDQVHVGDRIVLSYYTGIAAEVKRTGFLTGFCARSQSRTPPYSDLYASCTTEAVAVDVTPAPY